VANPLQASEIRYRRLFETARDGILLLDATTMTIIDANPFMTELLEYAHAEFVGKELWQIGLFKDKDASQVAAKELQEKKYLRYENLPLETKNGKKAEVEFVSNVYNEGDQQVVQCNIRDISDRVRLERELKDHADELTELHRRKDEFLAMMSHEIRNPLSPIMNSIQLLSLHQENENPIQQKARTVIERQVAQLKVIVDDLLEVSRITTGKIRLNRETIDLRNVVNGAVESANPFIIKQNHKLTVTMPATPIWLYADSIRLEQVIVNLLNNASKYTEPGGFIWLTVQEQEDKVIMAVMRVRDTGVGIAQDLLPTIFDPFMQAKRSLARSEGGLGVGLTIVKRLVELHDGTIEVSSVLGVGSEFVIELPLAAEPKVEPGKKDQVPNRPLRVLVVDDNHDAADTLMMLLQSVDHDVKVIHDGASTLSTALEYLPDAILLDIGLPGMDGYEVAKALRATPLFSKIVLVAVTGYSQKPDIQFSLDAGFDHHLSKPANFSRLQEILAGVERS
jgi:PAS domain S-box-containing protein